MQAGVLPSSAFTPEESSARFASAFAASGTVSRLRLPGASIAIEAYASCVAKHRTSPRQKEGSSAPVASLAERFDLMRRTTFRRLTCGTQIGSLPVVLINILLSNKLEEVLRFKVQ